MRPSLREKLPELALESAMIVLSVLLALAANAWAESRKQDRLGRQAQLAFAQELRVNRDRVARAVPYHDSLNAAIVRADSANDVRTYADWRRAFPGWSGLENPDITASAWQTAISTGALGNIPFGQVRELSDVYTVQGKLDAFNVAYVPVLDFSDAQMHDTVRRLRAYIQTVLSFEHYLLKEYDVALSRLDAAPH